MKCAILKNNFNKSHINWINACNLLNIEYNVIDLISSNWLKLIQSGKYDFLLACPPGNESLIKQMYDEKIFILSEELRYNVFPSYKEIKIYENKRFLSYWLMSKELAHPKTNVFYNKKEAMDFLKKTPYPIVGKFNIGASGYGVRILKGKYEAKRYIEKAFNRGLHQYYGPNLRMDNLASRLINNLKNKEILKRNIAIYKKQYNEIQKNYVIFQEFVPHEYEWRIVKIGESYFGHKKIKHGDKASGTKGVDYSLPPQNLLNYIKDICAENNFNSIAIDLFDNPKGKGWLINEMQTIFGHVQDHICEQDGKPGRYRFINGEWVFEVGMFNSNLSYDLRLKTFLTILTKGINNE